MISLESALKIDYRKVEDHLGEFLRRELEASGRKGYVVGLSGGVDSAASFALAARSIGKERVLPLIMPDSTVTPKGDVEDAKALATQFGTSYHVIDIAPIIDVYRGALPIYESEEADRTALGNLRARVRMNILYYYANKRDYLVLGTGDRSEILIGYFTKYGDAAVDVSPLAILYKTQVRRFALHLGVPEAIALKPSSPRLWEDHEAERELGLRYEEIDLVLYSHFDLGVPWEEIPAKTGVREELVERVRKLHMASAHKRLGARFPEPLR
ncbi:MAG: NAD+ synthase [Acidilobaceae archaeon]|nr:NAD+ synthase [Acidilobaceae archaeon]MCX8165207.1 NAD+ synthase [Acidilobaceae archaeon]MDW7974277.1 NAD+ synthase [Sulfolobales archaeon]